MILVYGELTVKTNQNKRKKISKTKKKDCRTVESFKQKDIHILESKREKKTERKMWLTCSELYNTYPLRPLQGHLSQLFGAWRAPDMGLPFSSLGSFIASILLSNLHLLSLSVLTRH